MKSTPRSSELRVWIENYLISEKQLYIKKNWDLYILRWENNCKFLQARRVLIYLIFKVANHLQTPYLVQVLQVLWVLRVLMAFPTRTWRAQMELLKV
jgi:hypothetical protein